MTPERERLVQEWEKAVEWKKWHREVAMHSEKECEKAERALAAYDAAHPKEDK